MLPEREGEKPRAKGLHYRRLAFVVSELAGDRCICESHQASRIARRSEVLSRGQGCVTSIVCTDTSSIQVSWGGARLNDRVTTNRLLIACEDDGSTSRLAPFTTAVRRRIAKFCGVETLSTDCTQSFANFSGLRLPKALYKTAWTESKLNKPRQLDPDGYRLRASCVCVRGPDEDEILLITSSRDSSRWVIPGGGIEPGESAVLAAERETAEEAGVGGTIDRLLGTFENEESAHRTIVFVLRVERELLDWQEKKMGRDRRWFPLAEARTLLLQSKPAQASYLDALKLSKPMLPRASVN